MTRTVHDQPGSSELRLRARREAAGFLRGLPVPVDPAAPLRACTEAMSEASTPAEVHALTELAAGGEDAGLIALRNLMRTAGDPLPGAGPPPARHPLRPHERSPRHRRPNALPARHRPADQHLPHLAGSVRALPGSLLPRRGRPDLTSSEITLFTSRHHGIAALVSGDSYRWARTALQLAGFEKDSDGNYVTPLTDPDRARRALTALAETARACQATVTTTDRRYIGDFAQDLSEHLPGRWSVQVENYSMAVWQQDLAMRPVGQPAPSSIPWRCTGCRLRRSCGARTESS